MQSKKTKNFFYLFVFILFIICWQVKANAYSGSSTAEAVLNYYTMLSVEALEPEVFMDYSGIGSIEFDVEFAVNANTDEVQMFVEATDLHFKQAEKEVSAIPLNTSAGANIDPIGAEGATRTANFMGSGEPIKGLASHKSDTLAFSSPDSLSFNHQVFVSLEWNQLNEQKHAGEYTAQIKLTCFINP